MARFGMGKDTDDIADPILLDEDWYTFEILEDPETKKNATMRENPADPKAGYNIVIPVATVSDLPEENGRKWTVYLPMPKPEDEETFSKRGMSIYDEKMQRIVDFALAFQGQVSGEEVIINKGGRGMMRVLQVIDKGTGAIINDLDTFGEYKPAE